jgi:Domain of unknown function (DUF4382)
MKKIAIFGLFAALLISCSNKNDATTTSGNVSLKASAVSATGKTSLTSKIISTVALTDFKVNIGQIKFETDEENEKHNSKDSIHEDVKLTGPFLLDLLDQNKTLSQVIASAPIPNGKYEEIKFKFEKSLLAGDMSGKTFLIKGTVNGKEFMIWSDKEIQIKMDFEDHNKDIAVNGNDLSLNIKLQIDGIMAKITELDSLGSLTDGNSDGVIEISTTAVDGNQKIGKLIKDLVEKECHLDDKD